MRRLLFMFTMAGMLLTTSCSKDELDTASSGNEAQVTFSLGLEGHIATRAISDGKSADKLVYAVFDKDGNRITGIEKKEISTGFPATVTLALAKGQTYKVAFWAQNSQCNAYEVADDMNVTVSYENATNNDETRDAFFKTTEAFTVTGSTSMDVVLKRPFAQINVGVEETDWTAAVASGIEIEKSTVTIQKAATKIDLVTGKVSDPIEVTYNLATIPAQLTPAEDLSVDVDGDGEKETYKWLSMSYILVDDESENGAAKATLEGLKFTFHPMTGNDIILEDGLNSVPVQRNWRTNILGKLLTGDITFTIKIDPNYEDDYIYPSESAQKLAMAAAYGGEVTLEEDVELPQTIIVANGNALTVNLNGHSIVNNNQSETATTGVFVVESGSKLTIQGEGTINGGSGSASNVAVFARSGSEVNISGGTFTVGKDKDGDGNSTIYAIDGTINISGGTFKTECDDTRYILNVGQTQGASGTIIVTGGTFIGYDPATGDDNLGGSFVAEGYTSVKTSETPAPTGTYRVVKNAESAEDAETAIGQTDGIVVVTQDMIADSWSAGKNSKLVVNTDATLSGFESATQTIVIGTGKSLTIEGEGTIESPDYKDKANHSAIWLAGSGTLTINGNVTIKNKGGNVSDIDAPIYFGGGGGSTTKTVTINDGYFYAYNDVNNQPNPCVYLGGSRYNGKCILNIYGGVFDSETKTNNYLINVQDGSISATYNKIQIYGGIFVGFNPADGDSGANIATFVADGYESIQITYNGETAWEVRKIGE